MTDQTTIDTIRKIVADILCTPIGTAQSIDEIQADTDLAALDADSLDLMEIGMAMEEQFGIEITDAELHGCKTVADLVKLVEVVHG